MGHSESSAEAVRRRWEECRLAREEEAAEALQVYRRRHPACAFVGRNVDGVGTIQYC